MSEQQMNPVNAGQEQVVDAPVSEQQPTNTEPQATDGQNGEVKSHKTDDNAKYAAARREAEAKSKQLEEQVKRLEATISRGGFSDIDTFTSAYENSLKEQENEQRRAKLESYGLTEEDYEALILQDPRVQEASQVRQEQERIRKEEKDLNEFFTYFKESTGHDFSENDVISENMRDLVTQGVPLKIAYAATEQVPMLMKQIAELQEKLDANDTNRRNAESSTGSISAEKIDDPGFISLEEFNTKKSDQRWVMKNLDKITKSRPKWR